MPILNRHESCWGLTLFKLGQRRIEIWYCPSGYEIKEHTHPKEDIELMYVFGSTVFYRRSKFTGLLEWEKMSIKKLFRCFSVKHYHSHYFTVGKWPLIFINFQKFQHGTKPMSAAIDFME